MVGSYIQFPETGNRRPATGVRCVVTRIPERWSQPGYQLPVSSFKILATGGRHLVTEVTESGV